MSVRDELSLLTPRLRRYARALLQASPAPNEAADDLVHTTFVRTLDSGLAERKSDLIIQVFSLLTQLNRDAQPALAQAASDRSAAGFHGDDSLARAGHAYTPAKGLSTALAGLRLEEREALLLVAVEGFNYAQAGRILHISRASLINRLGRARARLAEALADPQAAPGKRPAYLKLVK